MSLAAVHIHSDGRPFTAIVMAPGHITVKWCKEALETIPRLRVFLIDGLRDRLRDSSAPCGVNEVKLRRGQIVREGLHTTLTDLRFAYESQDCPCSLASGDQLRTRAVRGRARQRETIALLAACVPGGSPDVTWGAWLIRIRACGWRWAIAGSSLATSERRVSAR